MLANVWHEAALIATFVRVCLTIPLRSTAMRATPDVTSEPLAVASARRVSQAAVAEAILSRGAIGVRRGSQHNIKGEERKYQARQLAQT
jgi:hypothetical protein